MVEKINVPVVSTDLYPTLLELSGIKLDTEQHQDGISLKPLLESQNGNTERPIFFHYPHYSNQGGFPGAAVRIGDWKLLERFEDGQTQLYNLKEDLGEQNDLAQVNPQKVKQMTKLLHNWYKQTNAEFLKPKGGLEPWRP